MRFRLRLTAACLLGLVLLGACAAPTRLPTAAPAPANPPTPAPARTLAPVSAPTLAPAPRQPTPTPPLAIPALAATLTTLEAANRANPDLAQDSAFVQVYASAALYAPLQDLGSRYLLANPSAASVQLSVGGTLLDRVGAVGNIDVLISDDPAQFDLLRAANLLAAEPRVLTRSRLSLVRPTASTRPIASLKDLATPGTRWATTLPNTPLAAATNRMLARASALPAYGPTFGATVDRNVLMRVTNTDDLLQRIAAGEADATIVFSSDVSPDGRKQLQVIDLPDDVNEQLEFSVAVLKGPNGGGAQTFVAYLQSALAQTTLTRYGFVEPFSAPVELAAGEPSETFSPTFDVRGLVATPHTFTRAEIAQLPQESATLATPSGSATYTGTRLLNVFNAAGGAKLPTDINNAKLRVSVRITGADGSDLLMGWGTLDPDFGALGAIVAITRDGEPLGDPHGMARLIVPGDKDDGRSIPSIVRIELSDPGPATL